MGKQAWMVVLALGMWVGGCTTANTVTEGDRQVNRQTLGAVEKAQELLDALRAKDGLDHGMISIGAQALLDIRENALHLESVQGAPENPKPYTPENSKAARELSAKDHAGGSWLMPALGIGGAIAGVAATLAGMPWLAGLFPSLAGKVGKLAETGVKVITFIREKAEQNGGVIGVGDVLKIAKEENVLAGVQKLAVKKADALEEKLGLDFKVKLDPETPPPAVA